MHSVEIYEFKYDEKTSNLLKKLSEESEFTTSTEDTSRDSVCFEEIDFSFHEEDHCDFHPNPSQSCQDSYDSLDESFDELEDELAKLCSLESPWNKYARRELIGNFCDTLN